MKKIGRKRVGKYTATFKTKVLRSILEEGLSVVEASKRYSVSDQSIYNWLDGKQRSIEMDKKESVNTSDTTKEDLEALREALRLERLRVKAYEQLIKEAESYYNISIEKKSGSKQSKK